MTYNNSATFATNPILTFTDNLTNLPLAGGKLYTYTSGTTTLQATYTDNTLTTQNPNPIILNNYGQATVWLGPGNYRFNLLNAAGVQQAGYPMDNIQPTSSITIFSMLSNNTISSEGAGLIGFNPSLAYPAGTIGSNLSNLSLNTLPTNGAGLVGFSALNTYAAGTVGYALNNVPAFVGQSKFNFTPSANGSPNVGDVWYASAQQSLATAQGASGSSITVEPGGLIAVMSSKPSYFTCPTAGTSYTVTSQSNYLGSLTLPANFFVVGKTIEFQTALQVTPTATTTVWVNVGVGSGGVQTPLLNVTTDGLNMIVTAKATITATGSSGTGFGSISVVAQDSTTSATFGSFVGVNSLFSLSTLVSSLLTLNIQFVTGNNGVVQLCGSTLRALN